MRGIKKTIYETYLVVEGSGDFPFDMLRYDSCVPLDEQDARAIERSERRRIVLARRAVNDDGGTPGRWASFGWRRVLVTDDPYMARQQARTDIESTPSLGGGSAMFLFDVRVERMPAETRPNREPGWYVIDRDKIFATCDREEEANRIKDDLDRIVGRVGGVRR